MAGLREYAKSLQAEPGATDPAQEILDYHEQRHRDSEQTRADMEKAEKLKHTILNQLEQGTAPQVVLLNTIEAIRFYSGDYDFAKEPLKELAPLYKDYEQADMFVDKVAKEYMLLELKRQEARAKLQKSLERWVNVCGQDIKKCNALWQQLEIEDEGRKIQEDG